MSVTRSEGLRIEMLASSAARFRPPFSARPAIGRHITWMVLPTALLACATPAVQPASPPKGTPAATASTGPVAPPAAADVLIGAQQLNSDRLSQILERLGYKCGRADDGSVSASHPSRLNFQARIDKDLERVTFTAGGKLKDRQAPGLLEAVNRANLNSAYSTFAVSPKGILLISWCMGLGGGVTERQIDRYLTNASYEAKMLLPSVAEYLVP